MCAADAPRTRALLAEPAWERRVSSRDPPRRACSACPRSAPGDDLAALLRGGRAARGLALADGVLVVCQKIVSKAEGRVVDLATVEPRDEARRIAAEDGKDPRHIELVLRETMRVVRRGHGVLITETRHGFVCANAGVDLSNAPADDCAVLLPVDPDASARAHPRRRSSRAAPGPLGVIVTDTFGRPWREGLVDVALGCAGHRAARRPARQRRPARPHAQVTATATADQLAAAAGLLMRKDAGIPAVLCEGVTLSGDGSAQELVRKSAIDLFR